jgi:hypothetical protein
MADVVVVGQIGRDLVLRVGALPEAGGRPALSPGVPAEAVRRFRGP